MIAKLLNNDLSPCCRCIHVSIHGVPQKNKERVDIKINGRYASIEKRMYSAK